jgi:hypothetical protein
MSVKPMVNPELDNTEIDFEKIQDINYWANKWEVSPHQLIDASRIIESNNVKEIEAYLRGKGFAI